MDGDEIPDDTERALGLDPALVNIPEPLFFDMIRGLGARQGELEINALAFGSAGATRGVGGGPEMEYAFAPGYAFELELPVSERGVEAWKGGIQGTLPYPNAGRFIHGWLGIGEYLLHDPGGRASALYIAALRFGAWSALTMIGATAHTSRREPLRVAGLLHPSVYFDASPHVTVGLELNSVHEFDGTTDLLLLPQVHWQPTAQWKLQCGAGVHVDEAGGSLLAALRLSRMF